MIVLGKLFLEETTEMEQWPDILSSLVHSSLEAHCSYSVKFFKNHLRNHSLSNPSFLGCRFTHDNHVQHALHKGLSTQRVWCGACADALPSGDQLESMSKKNKQKNTCR